MAQPWYDPDTFRTLYGSLAGAFGGFSIGLAAGLGGDQARKGRLQPWTGHVLRIVSVVGGISFLVGVAALATKQPMEISLSLLIGGVALGLLPLFALKQIRSMNSQSLAQTQNTVVTRTH